MVSASHGRQAGAGTAIAMTQGDFVSLVKKRAVGEALVSVGSLCVLIALLATFDGRVREQISMRMTAGQPAAQVATAEATARGLLSVILVSARDQSIEHAPLVIFVVAAVVLLLFMLRT
jgi:hypothetical protein